MEERAKLFFGKLLEVANTLSPMRSVRGSTWNVVGCFEFKGGLYSFIIETEGRGTYRRVDKPDYANEWFDVIRVYKPRLHFNGLTYNGVKYLTTPTLEL